ncbi:MAG: hypothetical protein LBP30_03865 [Clostridiales Family XIII bacterium]|nr:hypothetical protein [Clostridiales Family XIII bacterium]
MNYLSKNDVGGQFLREMALMASKDVDKIEEEYGSYSVPEEWVIVSMDKESKKYFFAHESEAYEKYVTSISVAPGENPYSAAEHENFRYAILDQLTTQMENSDDKYILTKAKGVFTEQDYPMYMFTLEAEEAEEGKIQATTLYYIVGEKRHIFINLTDFHGENANGAEEAAQAIANSFVWNE